MDTEFDWFNPDLVMVPIRGKDAEGNFTNLNALDIHEVPKEVFDIWSRGWCESQGITFPEDLSEAVFDDPRKRMEFIDLYLPWITKEKKN